MTLSVHAKSKKWNKRKAKWVWERQHHLALYCRSICSHLCENTTPQCSDAIIPCNQSFSAVLLIFDSFDTPISSPRFRYRYILLEQPIAGSGVVRNGPIERRTQWPNVNFICLLALLYSKSGSIRAPRRCSCSYFCYRGVRYANFNGFKLVTIKYQYVFRSNTNVQWPEVLEMEDRTSDPRHTRPFKPALPDKRPPPLRIYVMQV